MAEMIVALSIVMMVVSLLLPQTVLVMQERKNIQLRYKAFVLLKKKQLYICMRMRQNSRKKKL